MVSVCTVPARGGRSWERFSGYKTLNRIPLPLPVMLKEFLQQLSSGSIILLKLTLELILILQNF